MKKTLFWPSFVLFMVFFVFMGIPQTVEAQQPLCCCGYDGTLKPSTVLECSLIIGCQPVNQAVECKSTSDFTAIGTVTDNSNDSCLTATNELIASYCITETEGLLKNTSPGCVSQGDCTVCDFIKVFSNVARLILGISGALALLLFIYGGFTWIISQGSSEQIEKGKRIIIGTLIGLLIVLGSWQITRIILITLLVSEEESTEQEKKLRTDILKVFTDPTYNPCTDPNFGTK